MQTKLISRAVMALAMWAVPAAHAAQPAFPDKPIRLIIGSAPGSGPDIIARLVADHLYGVWGQRVVVDSRPGVAGIISAELALRANPDGYTWMMLTSQLFVATSVYPNLKFNLDKDFVSIALDRDGAVRPDGQPAGAGEVDFRADRAREEAAGQAALRLGWRRRLRASVRRHVHAPDRHRHAARAVQGHPAGHRSTRWRARCSSPTRSSRPRGPTSSPAGCGRSASPRRSARPALPDVPAIAEVVPGYAMFGWYSLVAPKGTPEAMLAKASAEVVKAVKEPAFGERLKVLGIEIIGGGRKELDAFRSSERKRITELVKASGVEIK